MLSSWQFCFVKWTLGKLGSLIKKLNLKINWVGLGWKCGLQLLYCHLLKNGGGGGAIYINLKTSILNMLVWGHYNLVITNTRNTLINYFTFPLKSFNLKMMTKYFTCSSQTGQFSSIAYLTCLIGVPLTQWNWEVLRLRKISLVV